jgi:hypothetical protein
MSDIFKTPATEATEKTIATRRARRGEAEAEHDRTHFRVEDRDGYVASYSMLPPDNKTLDSVMEDLVAHFHGAEGTGFESRDLVVWCAGRIQAIVRNGPEGNPAVIRFDD